MVSPNEPAHGLLARLGRTLPVALPVMAGYVVIGLPAGILSAQCGLSPWMAFLMSATYYSGAGQFMLSNLWLAGQPALAIAASISLVNMRQLLYSCSFAPRFKGVSAPLKTLFSATVTDESFGVNVDRFAQDRAWTPADATAVNLWSMGAWAAANGLGAAAGDLLALPTDVASFAMTAIFICLLLCQTASLTTVVVAGGAMAATVACKLLGGGSVAVVVGAVVGVALGVLLDRDNAPADEKPIGAASAIPDAGGRDGRGPRAVEPLAVETPRPDGGARP